MSKKITSFYQIPVFLITPGERGFGMLNEWVNMRKPFMLRQAQHERLSHVPIAVFRVIKVRAVSLKETDAKIVAEQLPDNIAPLTP